jgi:hypothetical protein
VTHFGMNCRVSCLGFTHLLEASGLHLLPSLGSFSILSPPPPPPPPPF